MVSIDDDILRKQTKLAAVAHKFVLSLTDTENDSLDIFLKRTLADAISLTGSVFVLAEILGCRAGRSCMHAFLALIFVLYLPCILQPKTSWRGSK